MNYKKFVLLFENTASEETKRKYFLPLNIIQFLKILLEGDYTFQRYIELFNTSLNKDQHPSINNDCKTVFIYFSKNPWENEALEQEETPEEPTPEVDVDTDQKTLELSVINKQDGVVTEIDINEPTFPVVSEFIDGEEVGEEGVKKLFQHHKSKIITISGEEYLNDLSKTIREVIKTTVQHTDIEFNNFE